MDCEDCRHLMVVGLHNTGPRTAQVRRVLSEKASSLVDSKSCLLPQGTNTVGRACHTLTGHVSSVHNPTCPRPDNSYSFDVTFSPFSINGFIDRYYKFGKFDVHRCRARERERKGGRDGWEGGSGKGTEGERKNNIRMHSNVHEPTLF